MNPFGPGYHLDRAAFDQLLRDTVILKERGIDAANGYHEGGTSTQHLVKGRVVSANKNPRGTWEILTMLDPDTPSSAVTTETRFQARWIVDATGRKAAIASKVIVHHRVMHRQKSHQTSRFFTVGDQDRKA